MKIKKVQFENEDAMSLLQPSSDRPIMQICDPCSQTLSLSYIQLYHLLPQMKCLIYNPHI